MAVILLRLACVTGQQEYLNSGGVDRCERCKKNAGAHQMRAGESCGLMRHCYR
jgi:hypothetical protein